METPHSAPANNTASRYQTEVCVYGGTPSGVLAALAARQEGRSVLLVEPSRWVGGILGAGIKPMQDCPLPDAVGGITRRTVFAFEPSPPAIRARFRELLGEHQIPVIYEHRVSRVRKEGTRIVGIDLDLAPPDARGVPAAHPTAPLAIGVEAAVFIDASYEGDLMARAGVDYSTGREPASRYDETFAGVGAPTNWTPIDPYVIPGDPASGLLPMVEPDHGKPHGCGDDYTQAANYRFYITTDPETRVPLTPPDGYDPSKFELVGRYVSFLLQEFAGEPELLNAKLRSIFPGWLNAKEYNYRRDSLVTIAPLGLTRFYQDGDWPTRAAIWREHQDYLRGLHHFLSTDPRVPEAFRAETAAIGLDRTIHDDTEGWPTQLYIRITRRMKGRYTLTLADVFNRTAPDDAIGLALYGVDTYPVRRYAARHPETDQLGVATEGNMFIGGARGTSIPYPVSYRSITPQAGECTNLLVPICFSASYIAYASARMEPVFCLLGESAGVAAAMAVCEGKAVQEIDMEGYRRRLKERGQVLEWITAQGAPASANAPRNSGTDAKNRADR